MEDNQVTGTIRSFHGNTHEDFRGDIEDHEISSITADRMVLDDDDSVDPLADRWPMQVEFVVETGVLENRQGGPNDGQPHYTGGTLMAVNLYDDTGKKVMSMAGLQVAMAYIASTIEWDSGWNAVDHILDGGHTIIGSNVANVGDPDDGDRIRTGVGNDNVRARDGNDYIDDVGGRDVYHGGAGSDVVGYHSHRWADRGADQNDQSFSRKPVALVCRETLGAHCCSGRFAINLCLKSISKRFGSATTASTTGSVVALAPIRSRSGATFSGTTGSRISKTAWTCCKS